MAWISTQVRSADDHRINTGLGFTGQGSKVFTPPEVDEVETGQLADHASFKQRRVSIDRRAKWTEAVLNESFPESLAQAHNINLVIACSIALEGEL